MSSTLQGAGGIGGLLMQKTDSGNFLYLFDANRNVGQLVDAADDTIAAHYEYDPFGTLLAADGPEANTNPFRFSTKYLDAETGLYYYGYRYYNPELGRWTTRDPIEEDGGLNLYGFVGNNPIDEVDTLGLFCHGATPYTKSRFGVGKSTSDTKCLVGRKGCLWLLTGSYSYGTCRLFFSKQRLDIINF